MLFGSKQPCVKFGFNFMKTVFTNAHLVCVELLDDLWWLLPQTA